MRLGGLGKPAGVVALLALTAAACSGNHTGTGAAGRGGASGQVAANGTTTSVPGGKAAPVTTPGAALSANGSTSSGTGGGGATGSGVASPGGTSGTGPAVAGTHQTTAGGFSYTAANLYPASQDRVGITPSSLTLCMHAPLVFGPAFQDSATDFQVYWQWLNGQGGIDNRKVNMV